jgi:hypothetical protein
MMAYLSLVAVLITRSAIADWTPPAEPDPQAILSEAEADARAGHNEDALAKQVWFHDHALEIRPSLYGVRLSFALSNWHQLGLNYPPALEKLRAVRDGAAKQVFTEKDKEKARNLFADLSAINEELSDDDKTAEVFIALDKEAPERATQVYDLAQRALIATKNYRLCGKYLNPTEAYADIQRDYDFNVEFAAKQDTPHRRLAHEHLGESSYLEKSATLIALLVLNDQKPEAEKFAAEVKANSKHPKTAEVLNAALEGKVPSKFLEEEERGTGWAIPPTP